MNIVLLIVVIVLQGILLGFLVGSWRVFGQTHELLIVIQEWIEHAKQIRTEAKKQADRTEQKTDQMVSIAATLIPEKTAEKTAEKVAEKLTKLVGDSANEATKLPALRPEAGT